MRAMDREYLTMMGESKPNFALDLSNEGVALWHRVSGGGWAILGQVALGAPDFSGQIKALRNQVTSGSKGVARSCNTVVRIPRSEVMLSKVSLGVFEDEAAERHGLKQIEKMSPLPMADVAYDLGERGFGNMAPVGIVARQTLVEAEEFAKTHGFETLYFTTQYSSREFPREPRFYLTDQTQNAKPLWFVPWVAAASIGLALGYFGYSQLSAGNNLYDAPPPDVARIEQPADTQSPAVQVAAAQIETAAQTQLRETSDGVGLSASTASDTPPSEADIAEPETQADATAAPLTQLGLRDIAPNLPPVLITLNAPDVTGYPDLATKAVMRSIATKTPTVIRLKSQESDAPQLVKASKRIKTSDLQIAEARRDLPEVAVNDEIVAIIEKDMALEIQTLVKPEEQIQLAALTQPDRAFDPILLGRMPVTDTDANPVPVAAQQPAERPAPPPSLVTADPGTLTPTAEGTLGPDNILIFSGKPAQPPRDRPGSVLPVDPLAGFPPRLRPNTLTGPEPAAEDLPAAEDPLLAQAEPQTQAEPSEPLTILDIADPALRPLRAKIRPAALEAAQAEIAAAVAAENAPKTILDLADPALRPLRARLRPAALEAAQADAAENLAATQTPQNEPTSILALADPALRPLRARLRPAALEAAQADAAANLAAAQTAQNEPASILALADPALRPLRAKIRPDTLAGAPATSEPAPATAPDSLPDSALETTSDAVDDPPAEAAPHDANDPAAVQSGSETASLASDTSAVTNAVIDQIAVDQVAAVIAQDAAQQTLNAASVLASADPTLANFRAHNRPDDLRVLTPVEIDGLVALADPSLANKKSRTRPDRLRIIEPEPEPETLATPVEPQNTISSASAFAIAKSPSPKARPARLDRVVKRVTAEPEETRSATKATATTPRAAVGTVKPPPAPTHTNVANAASERANFRKSRMNLVGVFGPPNARRALVRMSSGRYIKVKTGDNLGGWRVSAIDESSLRIKKGSRNHVLKIP